MRAMLAVTVVPQKLPITPPPLLSVSEWSWRLPWHQDGARTSSLFANDGHVVSKHNDFVAVSDTVRLEPSVAPIRWQIVCMKCNLII